MTEDEAKTKWCPFARQVGTIDNAVGSPQNGFSGNRFPDDRVSLCLGSACMAWRVRHQWFDNAQQDPSWVDYAPYAFEPGEGQERDDGFCGLAGRP
jgi:hypothetical protein